MTTLQHQCFACRNRWNTNLPKPTVKLSLCVNTGVRLWMMLRRGEPSAYRNKTSEKGNRKLANQLDEAKNKYRERNRDYYVLASELWEECEKNKNLTAQTNRDFENSSILSSMQKSDSWKIYTFSWLLWNRKNNTQTESSNKNVCKRYKIYRNRITSAVYMHHFQKDM